MRKAERAALILKRLDELYPKTPVPLDHSDPRADLKSATVVLAGAVRLGSTERACPCFVLETAAAATDLDLISYLMSIPDPRMRRGVRFPAWYLLLVAVLGILSGCQSLRDLERFEIGRAHV